MKLTPKTVIISIIAAPFVLVIGADYASRISQNLSSTKPSITPSPIAKPSVTPSTPVKDSGEEYAPENKASVPKSVDSKTIDPEMWTSQNPNAVVTEETVVTSMDGATTYSTLRQWQKVKVVSKVDSGKVAIEINYALFKTRGYISVFNIRAIN